MVTTQINAEIRSVVPEFLAKLPRWLLWTAEPNGEGKKPRKVPRYANSLAMRSGKLGSDDDLLKLVTLEIALESINKNPHAGLGFAFIDGDNLIGIDIDDCIDTTTGELSPKAQKICQMASSYTEWSPSGNGLHIIVQGETVAAKCSQIEVYPKDRFFCFTGNALTEYPLSVMPAKKDFLEKIHKSIEATKKKDQEAKTAEMKSKTSTSNPEKTFSSDLKTEWEIIEVALQHIPASIGNDEWVSVGMAIKDKFGDSGFSLWDSWSRTSPDKYPSQSEMQTRWRSFKRDGVTAGTIIQMARNYGFVMPKKPRQMAIEQDQSMPIYEQENRETQVNQIDNQSESQSDSNDPDPMDLFGVFEPPTMKYEYLPDAIMDYCSEHSQLLGTDMSVIAMGVLVSAAACIHDGIRIQPKRHDKSWKESARLWAAVVGNPSTRKSPGFSVALREVKKCSLEMAKDNERLIAQYKDELEQWKSVKNKEQRGPEPKEPPQERLYVEDTTVEALSMILKDNPRGVMCFNDELSGWFASMDAYKGSSSGASKDKSHWLEAYNGGHRLIDRISRGSIVIPNWSVCVLGGIQPESIRKIASSLTNDGLLQRFMVVCPPKANDDIDREADQDTNRNFESLFRKLLSIEPPEGSKVVVFSEDAHQCRERVKARSIALMEAFESPHIKAWLGKWTGLYARLALLYHTIECAERGIYPTDTPVSFDNASRVEQFMCQYLLHHAVHFYNEIMEASDRTEHVRQIARLILSRRASKITKRDLMRYWKPFKRIEMFEVKSAMDTLQISGWITANMNDVDVDGKPKTWMVNPKVHDRFKNYADQERIRRESAREVFLSIKPK